jgi:hypothetical protein
MKKCSAKLKARHLAVALHRQLMVCAAIECKTLKQTIVDALLAYVKHSPRGGLRKRTYSLCGEEVSKISAC